jgi:hypothetical protein
MHSRSAWRRLAAGLGLAAACTVAGAANEPAGDPAFAQSRFIDVPSRIVAGQPFTLKYRVRNDGPTTHYTRVTFDLPSGLLLAAPAGECFTRFDPERRQFVHEGSIAAGWDATCSLQLVAAPDMSNHASFSLRMFTPPDRYGGAVATAPIDHVPAPAEVRVGGFGITRAGVVVLGFLVLLAVVFVAGQLASRGADASGGRLSQRSFARSAPLVAVVCLGFLTFFGVMAWDDWRTLSHYRETRCDVLDGNVKFSSVSSTSGSSTRNRSADTTRKPVLSLRYAADGKPMHSLGFSTDSRLSYSASDLEDVMAAFAAGRSVPCWFDPEDPRRVVVLRGFGGAYVFAVIPLLVLALIAWLMPRKRDAARDKAPGAV